ncbi:MAG TPA: hypothetical protein VFN37_08920 [Candidatus Baltobacteraceae bacterium]|nr:hypothetical protein [Candidatus Baltobacteraceae bacterium]
MFTPKHEPLPQELERLLTDEERDALSRASVPDEVRAEIFERLERRSQTEREEEQAEDRTDADRPVI